MAKVFLSLLFLLPNGQIISGNKMDGWHDLPMPTMEACLELSKSMYAKNYHVTQKPKRATSMISFCKVIIK